MAKKTINREEIVKKMVELEGNLMDYIPENEKGTDRVKLLDRIMAVNAGEEKLSDDEMQKLYEEGASLLKVETEVKKAKKSAGKKKAEEKSEQTEGKPKKKLPAKKEKAEPKADAPKKEKKSLPAKKEEKPAFEFPNKLETEEDGDFKLVKIKKLSDIEEGDLIAGDWTEEDLANLEYDTIGVLRKPKKFDKDIDVCVVLAVSEEIVYALSIATNKMYHFLQDEVKDMNSNGMLWRVYKPVGE